MELSWLRIHLQCGRPGFNPWVGRSPGEGKGCPLQYSGLENSMDCVVHGVTKSRTQLSGFHFHFKAARTWGIKKEPHRDKPILHQFPLQGIQRLLSSTLEELKRLAEHSYHGQNLKRSVTILTRLNQSSELPKQLGPGRPSSWCKASKDISGWWWFRGKKNWKDSGRLEMAFYPEVTQLWGTRGSLQALRCAKSTQRNPNPYFLRTLYKLTKPWWAVFQPAGQGFCVQMPSYDSYKYVPMDEASRFN